MSSSIISQMTTILSFKSILRRTGWRLREISGRIRPKESTSPHSGPGRIKRQSLSRGKSTPNSKDSLLLEIERSLLESQFLLSPVRMTRKKKRRIRRRSTKKKQKTGRQPLLPLRKKDLHLQSKSLGSKLPPNERKEFPLRKLQVHPKRDRRRTKPNPRSRINPTITSPSSQ